LGSLERLTRGTLKKKKKKNKGNKRAKVEVTRKVLKGGKKGGFGGTSQSRLNTKKRGGGEGQKKQAKGLN